MTVVLTQLFLIANPLWRWLRLAVATMAAAMVWGAPLCQAQAVASSSQASQQVHIPIKVQATALEQPQDYFVTLLTMVLEASKADDEVIDIIFSPHNYSQSRWISWVAQDPDDFVIWTMASKAREQLLRPIRFPLFKGLFSYRVLLIREGEQARFDQVKSLQDLAQLVAGQGSQWPDTHILAANHIPVTGAENVESLFRMLKARRFDYFPRGVSEAWFELTQRREQQLRVEDNILLYYPAPMYFFVNKRNEVLAQRIELGFKRLVASGEFDRFFYKHARVALALAELQKHPRRLFELTNPDVPDAPLVGVKGYWLAPPFTADLAQPLAP